MKGRARIEDALHPGDRVGIWLGAVSFEDRCTASLLHLQRHGVQVGKVVAFDYRSQVRQAGEDAILRDCNRRIISDAAYELVGRPSLIAPVDPYSFDQAQKVFGALQLAVGECGVIDVSCLTKIHTMAIAEAIVHRADASRWILAYTMPENYGTMTDDGIGWEDTLTVALGTGGQLANEHLSRGILLLGHEVDRLRVALAEIQPAGGIILNGVALNRPDFRRLSEGRNVRTLKYLRDLPAADWTEHLVDTRDAVEVERLCAEQIARAREARAPVFIFPFGPKPLVFFTALTVCAAYPQSSWVVYPLPRSYDVRYSEGAGPTIWFTDLRAARELELRAG